MSHSNVFLFMFATFLVEWNTGCFPVSFKYLELCKYFMDIFEYCILYGYIIHIYMDNCMFYKCVYYIYVYINNKKCI